MAKAGDASGAPKMFVLGVVLNLVFVVIEFYFGWRASSTSLMADAGHNLSDVGALTLAWGATWLSQRRPNPSHTFGWQRGTIVSALMNSMFLMVAMGFIAWEAISHLSAGVEAQAGAMLWVGAVGIIINGITAWLFSAETKDLNIRGVFLHAMSDAMVSLAVVLGGAVYLRTGWKWIDPGLSIVIAFIVAIGSVKLFLKALHLMFEGVPESIDVSKVSAYLLSRPGVAAVHDLHVWAISTFKVALSAHLVIPGRNPGDQFLAETSEGLREQFSIDHSSIQIEQAPTGGCVMNRQPCE